MSAPSYPRVTIEAIPVMYVAEKGPPHEVAEKAFERLEAGLGDMKGRKFYGYFDPTNREYHACVAVAEGDDTDAKGFARETLPGGVYLRARLKGEPAETYPRIGQTFDQMGMANDTKDPMRPWIEFYRARDEVDLLVPVL
jgi:DNA gyrase inhibitor GyrI